MKKIKKKLLEFKNYLKILTDFKDLNRYVYYSSIFINRVDRLLKSKLDEKTVAYNLSLCYSDFKIEYIEDLDHGITISKFDIK